MYHEHNSGLGSNTDVNLSAEAIDNHADSSLHVDAPLLEVEQLVLSNLGGGCLMLHLCCWIPHLQRRMG